MSEFERIFVVWRKGSSERRTAIGILCHKQDGTYEFKYNDNVKSLEEDGFSPYPEFQDLDKTYNGNVVDIFGQRLTKNERPDVDVFYDFWEVDKEHKNNKFYLLGKTQGLSPTDNFEFLADYLLTPDLHFLTEIAGLSHSKLDSGSIQMGDKLTYQLESTNPKDPYAVKVFKGELELGYIKKYHSKVFHDAQTENKKLSIEVKAIEKNGIIKRIFVRVSL